MRWRAEELERMPGRWIVTDGRWAVGAWFSSKEKCQTKVDEMNAKYDNLTPAAAQRLQAEGRGRY